MNHLRLFASFAVWILLTAGSPWLHAQTGAVDPAFTASVKGEFVTSTAVQPDGMVIVAGDFTAVNGTALGNLARLNPDGSVDPAFQPGSGPNKLVESVAVQADGMILIGGEFTSIGVKQINSIARLNTDGTVDSTFHPGSGPDSFVYCVAVQADGKILLGGPFTTVAGVALNGIARLNTDGSVDTSFQPGSGANSDVYSVAVQDDGRILIGGPFTSVAGTACNHVARLNADGSLDASFTSSLGESDKVLGMALQADGEILLGGAFTAGTAHSSMVRLNAAGAIDASFTPGNGASDNVGSIALQANGQILLGGGFNSGNGMEMDTIIRLNADGSVDPAFRTGTGPNNDVDSVAVQADGAILLGGYFTSVNGQAADECARLLNDAVTQSLSVPDQTQIQWLRGGTVPEVGQVTFELSTDGGTTWSLLGSGTRITGGWQLTGQSLPASGVIRARGRTSGGFLNAGSGIVEQVQAYPVGSVDPFFAPNIVGTSVNAVTVQPDGGILLGGDFVGAGGTAANDIARLTASGLADGTFNAGTGANAEVDDIAVQTGGDILLGGQFTSVNGLALASLAQLSAGGSVVANFNSAGAGANSSILSVAVQGDGNILVGGSFTTLNGTAIGSIARLTTAGALDFTFNPGPGANGTVNSIALQTNGAILVGGAFSSLNGAAVGNFSRLNTDGSVDATFNAGGSGANATVNSIVAQADGTILIGGAFATVNGVPAGFFARLNSDGSVDSTFNSGGAGANAAVSCIAVQTDGQILLGGTFTSVNGTAVSNLARLNTDGTLDTTFNPGGAGATGSVTAIVEQADGEILIGGGFTGYNGSAVTGIERLNPDGSVDTTFNIGSGTNEPVDSIALQTNGDIVLTGQFTVVNSTSINRIARLNTDGTVDTTFDSGGAGANAEVDTVALQPADGKILLGGVFTSVNATAIQSIARLNTDGTLDGTFDVAVAGANAPVNSIAVQANQDIVLGGAFTSVDGTALNYFARLNPTGGVDPTFDPSGGANAAVDSVALQADGLILLGGAFTTVNGAAAGSIVRLNADGSNDANFNPGPGANGTVAAVAVQPDGLILIGGAFSSVNNTALNSIARLNADGSIDPNFNPGSGVTGSVGSMALQADGKILVGGQFTAVNGMAFNGLVRLNADGSIDATFNPGGSGPNGLVNGISLQADGSVLLAGQFTSFNGTAANCLARLVNYAAVQTLSVSSDLTQIQWSRAGAAPEVSQVNFALSADGGTTWTSQGTGVRVSGGWQLTGLSLPPSGLIRAQGSTSGGYLNGSSGLQQQIQAYGTPVLSSVSIASTNANTAYAKAGDLIVLSFTASGALQTPSAIIDGQTATVTAGTNPDTWQATVTVTSAFPQGLATFSIATTDDAGNSAPPVTGVTDGSSVTVDTVAPVLNVTAVVTTGYQASGLLPDLTGSVTATDAGGTVTLTQSPVAGTVLAAGSLTVTFTGTDPAGNSSQAQVKLTVSYLPLVTTIGLAKGGMVTGRPASATYASFATPETGDFAGSLLSGGAKSSAIFAADGSVLLEVGGTISSISGSVISKLGQPSGDAVLATLQVGKGGITAKDDVVLLIGLSAGSPQVGAQTGTAETGLPANVTIKSFGTLDGNGTNTFFLATLQGTGVTPEKAPALCAILGAGDLNILVRRGDVLTNGVVAVIGTLVGSKGTLADGRWRADGTDLGVRLTLAGKAEGSYLIPATASGPTDWTPILATGAIQAPAALQGTAVNSLGLPGFGLAAEAELLNLHVGPGGVTAANDVALVADHAGAYALLAQKGDAIAADANGNALTGVTIKAMSDPVVGGNGQIAFLATMAGHGVSTATDGAIEYAADGLTPVVLANIGALAPGGGHWASFSSMVLPAGVHSGPIFLGKLKVSAADGVTAKNDLGLWGFDSTGALQLLLRTGQSPAGAGSRIIETFTALAPTPGSIGAASGYDDTGDVEALVTFTDHSQALLTVTIP